MYLLTDHKKGFVSDVKINESVKNKDRYESLYLTKVKKWLHTFNESLEEGKHDAYANDDQDSASQLAEYDIESEQRVCSNAEMFSAESSLYEADQNVWNDMVSYSENINDSEVNDGFDEKLTRNDRRIWDDILQNSRLPDYESSNGVQEGEADISDVDQEKEFRSEMQQVLAHDMGMTPHTMKILAVAKMMSHIQTQTTKRVKMTLKTMSRSPASHSVLAMETMQLLSNGMTLTNLTAMETLQMT